MLSGAMISMGRLLEKPGPKRYSPECVEEDFCELRPYRVLGRSHMRSCATILHLFSHDALASSA